MSIVVRRESCAEVELSNINDVWVYLSEGFPSQFSSDLFFAIEGEAFIVSDLLWKRSCSTLDGFINFIDWDDR